MALLTKPNMQQVWASGGDIVEPSDLKKQQGWTVEVPPHQFENWIQNRQDEYLAHINQRGIPAWDGLTNYEAGGLSYVQGSDGKVYKSVAASGPASVVSDPPTDVTDTYWTIAFADVGAFLTQTAGDVRYTQRSNNLSDLTNVAAARTNMALGTAATANLTTSNTDGTVGRVLKVGDFGLGVVGETPVLANIDSHYLATGLYWFANGAGTPPTAYGYVLVQRADAVVSMQTCTDVGATQQWIRYSDGSVWSAWRGIALTNSPAFTGIPTAPTAAAGTNTTQLANTAFVKATVDNSAIGVGQTWQGVTGSRAAGTTYTNTTGRPIMVMLTIAIDTVHNLYINGLLMATPKSVGGGEECVSFVVPPGNTYSISVMPIVWAELR